MTAPNPPSGAWSAETLTAMRMHTDELADRFVSHAENSDTEVVGAIAVLHATDEANRELLLRRLDATSRALLDRYVADVEREVGGMKLAGTAPDDIAKGQLAFQRLQKKAALVLLTRIAFAECSVPRIARARLLAGDLYSGAPTRLRMVVRRALIAAAPRTAEGSVAFVRSLARERLMHARLRVLASRMFPELDVRRHGSLMSSEDVLALTMTYAVELPDGLAELGEPFSAEEAESWVALWRQITVALGVPAVSPTSGERWVPGNAADARAFLAKYRELHQHSDRNDEGALLARVNLEALRRSMPAHTADYWVRRMAGSDRTSMLGLPMALFGRIAGALFTGIPGLWRLFSIGNSAARRHETIYDALIGRIVTVNGQQVEVNEKDVRASDMTIGMEAGASEGREQFLGEVFPAEIAHIRTRRKSLSRMAAYDAPSAPRPLSDVAPSAKANDLIGLALSGGGIRTASLGLGAVQALAGREVFKKFDYLSTVSGGGYTGSMLSSVLNAKDACTDGKEFPVAFREGDIESPTIQHLRNGSNYLAGGGFMNVFRLPTVIFRGLLLNAVIVAPFIIMLAAATFAAYPGSVESSWRRWVSTAIYLVALLPIFLYPLFVRLRGRKLTWRKRDLIEVVQTTGVLAMVITATLGVAAFLVNFAMSESIATWRATWTNAFRTPNDVTGYIKWALVAVVVLGVVSYLNSSEASRGRSSRLTPYLIGFTAPVAILVSYLAVLIIWARSPFIPQKFEEHLDRAVRHGGVVPHGPLRVELEGRGAGASSADCGAKSFAYTIEPIKDSLGGWRVITQSSELKPVTPNPVNFNCAFGRTVPWWTAGDARPDLTIRRDPDGDSHLIVYGSRFGEYGYEGDWIILLVAVLIGWLNYYAININVTSPHSFWRDRLSRVFLIRAQRFSAPAANDKLQLSQLGTENEAVPYHIVNTTLNLQGSQTEARPARGSDFFMFSRSHVGSFTTGYCATTDMERADPHVDLGTAMAISSAATAPNAGAVTVGPLVFFLTLLNIRLDYWAPNPRTVRTHGSSDSSVLQAALQLLRRPGQAQLFREAMGWLDGDGKFVNLSDGGHIENLAIYELLRRRCKLIVCSDGEADPGMTLASFATLIRYARIDLGIHIDIDVAPLKLGASGDTTRHWTLGTIEYGPGETGYLLYVKSSMTGDEPIYVNDYRRQHPTFPHEPTSDQFFTEPQFEAYRALGFHSMGDALDSIERGTVDSGPPVDPEVLDAVRRLLDLRPPESVGQTGPNAG